MAGKAATTFEAPWPTVLRRRLVRARTFEFTVMGLAVGASIGLGINIALPDTYRLLGAHNVQYPMFIPKMAAYGASSAFLAAMFFPWRNR